MKNDHSSQEATDEGLQEVAGQSVNCQEIEYEIDMQMTVLVQFQFGKNKIEGISSDSSLSFETLVVHSGALSFKV